MGKIVITYSPLGKAKKFYMILIFTYLYLFIFVFELAVSFIVVIYINKLLQLVRTSILRLRTITSVQLYSTFVNNVVCCRYASYAVQPFIQASTMKEGMANEYEV